jgi:hypothetical protein
MAYERAPANTLKSFIPQGTRMSENNYSFLSVGYERVEPGLGDGRLIRNRALPKVEEFRQELEAGGRSAKVVG